MSPAGTNTVQKPAAPPATIGASLTFTDNLGRPFVNARVIRLEPGGIVVMTSNGVVHLPAVILPEAIKKKFGVEHLGQAPPTSKSPPTNSASALQETRVTVYKPGAVIGKGSLRKGLPGEHPAVGGGGIKNAPSTAAGGGGIRSQTVAPSGGGGIARPPEPEQDPGMVEAIGRAQTMASEGRLATAASELARLQDQRSRVAVAPENKDQFVGACMDLFEQSRQKDEFAVARASLETAVNMHSGSYRIMEGVLGVFGEARERFSQGEFRAGFRQIELTEGVGLEQNLLYVRRRHALSNTALTSFWPALLSLDLPRAGAALGVARKLWDHNPAIARLDLTLTVIAVLVILAALILAAKFCKKGGKKGGTTAKQAPQRRTGY